MSFSYTPIEAFLSFATDLGEGEWGGVDAEPFLTPDAPSSLSASCVVRWKLRLERARRGLSALRVPAKTRAPVVIDRSRWDPAQRRLKNELQRYIDGSNEAKKTAANDMFPVFLVGKGGLEQTQYKHPAEVRHGRMQGHLANDEYKESVALLALEAFFQEIDEATAELAEAIGMGPNQESQASTARGERERQAKSECIGAFSAVLDDIEHELGQNNLKPDERTQLEGLLSPLVALRDQYTAPEKEAPVGDSTGKKS
jgi:hypothetical protein